MSFTINGGICCGTFANNLGGVEREGRDLLLQAGDGQTTVGDLFLWQPLLASHVVQLSLQFCALAFMDLLHLRQLRAEIRRGTELFISGAGHNSVQAGLSTQNFL